MTKPLARVVALALVLAGVSTAAAQAPVLTIDRANMDTTCRACDNFNQYANGGWLKTASIPAAYSVWGSFTELSDKNEAVVHKILDESTAGVATAKPGTNAWKIGTFYGACMDSARIETLGYEPLKPALEQIAAFRTTDELAGALGLLEHQGGLAPFGIGAGQDAKHSTEVIASAGQGGLGLPERDYYLKTDAKSQALRDKYVEHVAKSLMLIGESADQAQADAAAVLSLETALATASMPRVAMRDPNATYHKMSLVEFQQLTPHIDWNRYLLQVGAKGVTTVNVRQPDFFKALDGLLTSVPLADWKSYMRWRAVNAASSGLSSAFVNESFSWSRNLTGTKEQLPRWKRCLAVTNGVLGEAVGEEYVRRTFTPEAKARALAMVNNLRDALKDRIGQLTWMSDSTKQQALVKLEAFTRKIGYPDKWRDYSALDVRQGEYLRNLRLASAWSQDRNWAKIGKPVDRTEWGMTPPTVNAYYNPTMNEIVFPAGILQPPFYDPNADDAINYGGMGAVIGHEMTHGFDDQGRQFDAAGNLRDWWTPADANAYKARATLVSNQFDAYTVLDSATHVNGKLTLGENIADLGGLTVAFEAFQKAMAGKPRPKNIGGFTPEQRFFLSWAQVWRQQVRPEQARMLVNVDPHSPSTWRVNGPLSNMPEFAKAFGCKAGDLMVRSAALRAQIW